MPRFEEGRGLYGITREDARAIEAAGLTEALVFVHTEHWTDYASLSWLNEPSIADGGVIFAQSLGRWWNGSVMKTSGPPRCPQQRSSGPPVDRYDSTVFRVEGTGTSVRTSKNRIRRFLKPIRTIRLRSQVPVPLARKEC